eukprot:TRINITY_DN695_c0_g1::TRINITY_DN695_c0_g1_i1::g.28874::m.28874 TRINITY_DN695_c0_g1::TRINITY_DN695_c0_g1_i1::g.28874  ORF type:complete len:393 (-),score=67.09,sp/Q9URW6/YIE2_SCHPO/47.14/7e-53,DUF500/PF04366.7/9.3e-38,FYVE/PF01363.16/3.1e-19,zf-Sec23_Sec24/PF04810.10/2.3,C1_4/PF07975.7/0.21,C1_4/PF07975.7/8.3e+03,IBR/PF01485.16/4.1 TRINITY_DN695_c0_g1_i1:105-1235(-)
MNSSQQGFSSFPAMPALDPSASMSQSMNSSGLIGETSFIHDAEPPVWQPDSEAPRCTACMSYFSLNKKLTFQKLRHHCRMCGKVFCGNCSNKKSMLPVKYGQHTPKRVCHTCYDKLAPYQEYLCNLMCLANQVRAPVQDDSARMNNPISFSLSDEITKAASTVLAFSRQSKMNPDKSVPRKLLEDAKALVFMTVLRAGFIFTGKIGTGLVIARTPHGWSAPSAVALSGVGWGAQVGGELTDFLIIVRTTSALNAFAGNVNLSVGGGLSIAAGPVGRRSEIDISAGDGGISACYSYSMSKGLFAGVSLEGSLIFTRSDLNCQFYGRDVKPKQLLLGEIPPPRGAEPLYQAIEDFVALHDSPSSSRDGLHNPALQSGI